MSGKRKGSDTTQTVVQGGDVTPRWRGRAGIVLAAVVVLAVALALGWWLQHRHDSRQQKTDSVKLLQQTQLLINNHAYTLAEQQLQHYVAGKPPATYRAQAYLQLAAAYMNAGSYSKAIDAYNQAGQLDNGVKLAAVSGLAYAYQAAGDKQHAIAAFKQAISLTNTGNDPMAKADIASYTYEIKQLGGTP